MHPSIRGGEERIDGAVPVVVVRGLVGELDNELRICSGVKYWLGVPEDFVRSP